eukprot:TRINITY_DN8248_c1_g1_i1.p1 TRINITY_DN8248_c1_g1~~TRINITY_DN8248_c1_g1_i1.p1  ORF type:complete len:214 (+),score=-17.08 TRINITY_DN8248_c1_g1_i1:428-1069(+)
MQEKKHLKESLNLIATYVTSIRLLNNRKQVYNNNTLHSFNKFNKFYLYQQTNTISVEYYQEYPQISNGKFTKLQLKKIKYNAKLVLLLVPENQEIYKYLIVQLNLKTQEQLILQRGIDFNEHQCNNTNNTQKIHIIKISDKILIFLNSKNQSQQIFFKNPQICMSSQLLILILVKQHITVKTCYQHQPQNLDVHQWCIALTVMILWTSTNFVL